MQGMDLWKDYNPRLLLSPPAEPIAPFVVFPTHTREFRARGTKRWRACIAVEAANTTVYEWPAARSMKSVTLRRRAARAVQPFRRRSRRLATSGGRWSA